MPSESAPKRFAFRRTMTRTSLAQHSNGFFSAGIARITRAKSNFPTGCEAGADERPWPGTVVFQPFPLGRPCFPCDDPRMSAGFGYRMGRSWRWTGSPGSSSRPERQKCLRPFRVRNGWRSSISASLVSSPSFCTSCSERVYEG